MAKSYGEFSMPVTRSRTAAGSSTLFDAPSSQKKNMSSREPPAKKNTPGKSLDVEEPDKTAPPAIRRAHPVVQWIIYSSKKILKIDPLIKAGCYLLLSVICSSVAFLAEPYREYSFFQKSSFLNQWFVKLSWGWTFWLLLIFFVLCGYVESGGRMQKIGRNVTRLLVGTAVWYTVTMIFIGGIEKTTGKCSRADILSRKECLAGGETWGQFDISGHAFLLVYCSLLILEEARGFFSWEKEDQLEDSDDGTTTRQFELSIKPKVILAIRVITVAVAVLAVLWDWMLLVTLVYYHSFIQRFLGVALGVLGWFVTYRVWYPRCWPGLPGDMQEETQ